jgi:hypothetical protein
VGAAGLAAPWNGHWGEDGVVMEGILPPFAGRVLNRNDILIDILIVIDTRTSLAYTARPWSPTPLPPMGSAHPVRRCARARRASAARENMLSTD